MTDKEKYPSELAERFQVRLPEGMRDRIREAAERNNRSMNAEIVARLELSLDLQGESQVGSELAKLRDVLTREVVVNATLRHNFDVLANALAGQLGADKDKLIAVLATLRIRGRPLPE